MEYNYKLISEFKIIKVTVKGDISAEETALMGKTIRVKAKEIDYKIFFDLVQTRNRISIFEAYSWFADHYDKIDVKLRYIPTAYLSNEKDRDFFRFFETTCLNKGIRVRMFMEMDKAMEWLKPI